MSSNYSFLFIFIPVGAILLFTVLHYRRRRSQQASELNGKDNVTGWDTKKSIPMYDLFTSSTLLKYEASAWEVPPSTLDLVQLDETVGTLLSDLKTISEQHSGDTLAALLVFTAAYILNYKIYCTVAWEYVPRLTEFDFVPTTRLVDQLPRIIPIIPELERRSLTSLIERRLTVFHDLDYNLYEKSMIYLANRLIDLASEYK